MNFKKILTILTSVVVAFSGLICSNTADIQAYEDSYVDGIFMPGGKLLKTEVISGITCYYYDNYDNEYDLVIDGGGYNIPSNFSDKMNYNRFEDLSINKLYVINTNVIGSYAFSYLEVSEIYLGDSITEIGHNSFKDNAFNSGVTIPKNVKNIYPDSFDCSCTNFYVVEDNSYLSSYYGALYTKDYSKLIDVPSYYDNWCVQVSPLCKTIYSTGLLDIDIEGNSSNVVIPESVEEVIVDDVNDDYSYFGIISHDPYAMFATSFTIYTTGPNTAINDYIKKANIIASKYPSSYGFNKISVETLYPDNSIFDYNFDGEVDAEDALGLLNCIVIGADDDIYSGYFTPFLLDPNRDGDTTSEDALCILQRIVGLIDEPV